MFSSSGWWIVNLRCEVTISHIPQMEGCVGKRERTDISIIEIKNEISMQENQIVIDLFKMINQ
jgi:hypothetical protein